MEISLAEKSNNKQPKKRFAMVSFVICYLLEKVVSSKRSLRRW